MEKKRTGIAVDAQGARGRNLGSRRHSGVLAVARTADRGEFAHPWIFLGEKIPGACAQGIAVGFGAGIGLRLRLSGLSWGQTLRRKVAEKLA